ncbi:MAG: CPBP family intramembrane metalloprotease [Deltaproteobacteria bacterium]|nr:CPBP family intramembrane metalloprotease [Deltaproteobacteria bacterium]
MTKPTLAPRWHTAALVALMLTVALVGTLAQVSGAPTNALSHGRSRITGVYLPMLAVQWVTLFYVCRVKRPEGTLRALLGARHANAARMGADLLLAVLGCVLVATVEHVWSRFGGRHAPSGTALLPQTTPERLAWIVVAVSVGFCEELTFRGYLQTQFEAFTGHVVVAVVLQAALFGIAHGEQGVSVAIRAALYGLGFGALAWWRRSLWPGIACHVANDLAAGLLQP